MINKIKCVIFDLDGTLLNTIEDITDALNIAYKKNGLEPYSVKEVMYFVGSGVDLLIERSLNARSLSREYFNNVKSIYLTEYKKLQKNKTKPYEGIFEMLSLLKQRGLKMAVISNKPQIDTEEVIAYYFPKDIFTLVIGAKKEVPLKPNPEVVLAAMKELEVVAKETIYIGDSDIDMQTAINANLTSIGCAWGFRTIEDLAKNKASYIVNHPQEIVNLIN